MADGDYERGRGREIAAIAARLKRLAAERDGRAAAPSLVSGASRPALVSGASRPALVSGASRPALVSGASRPALVPGASRPALVPGASRPALVSGASRPALVSGASRPGILVLNGWASSPHAWDLCTFMSRPGVRLFPYVDQLAGQPERFLGDRAPAKFVVVGWSMGGSGALRLACRFPGQVAGLVLVAATPRMMEDKEAGWRGMSPRRLDALRKGLEITHGEGFFGVPEGKPNPYMVDAPENLEGGLKYLLETDVRADLERMFSPRSGETPLPPGGAPGPRSGETPLPPGGAPGPRSGETPLPPGGAQDVQHSTFSVRPFPVHVFQSERDGIVRAENAAYLKSVFPQAAVTMVPGSEHALPIMIPKEIDDAVDACLAVAAQG